jgi:hypothetical protein
MKSTLPNSFGEEAQKRPHWSKVFSLPAGAVYSFGSASTPLKFRNSQ